MAQVACLLVDVRIRRDVKERILDEDSVTDASQVLIHNRRNSCVSMRSYSCLVPWS